MPHVRRTPRILLAMMALVGVAMSVGCMRSSNLRSSAGPLPELSPAGELHPVAGEMRSATAAPPTAPAAGGPIAATSPALDPRTATGGSAASSPPGIPAMGLTPTPKPDPASSGGASPPSAATEAASGAIPDGDPSAAPALADGVPASPASSPTPLLDAEIRRVQAVTRQHFESIGAAAAPRASDPLGPTADRPTPAPSAEPKPADPDAELDPPLPPLAASARIELEPATERPAPKPALPPFMPVDPAAAGSAMPSPAPSRPAVAEEHPAPPPVPAAATAIAEADREAGPSVAKQPESAEGAPAEASRVAGVAAPPAVPADRDARPPLEITALRLCSRVKGFGSFEPIDPDSVRPGRRIGIYWEMAGQEYEARGDVFVSRLAAHLELRSESDRSVVWEYSPPTAEDVCAGRRRDYFASFAARWPETLPPGPYRLRLTQTDLVGNRTASREITVTIVR